MRSDNAEACRIIVELQNRNIAIQESKSYSQASYNEFLKDLDIPQY